MRPWIRLQNLHSSEQFREFTRKSILCVCAHTCCTKGIISAHAYHCFKGLVRWRGTGSQNVTLSLGSVSMLGNGRSTPNKEQKLRDILNPHTHNLVHVSVTNQHCTQKDLLHCKKPFYVVHRFSASGHKLLSNCPSPPLTHFPHAVAREPWPWCQKPWAAAQCWPNLSSPFDAKRTGVSSLGSAGPHPVKTRRRTDCFPSLGLRSGRGSRRGVPPSSCAGPSCCPDILHCADQLPQCTHGPEEGGG